jgi:hypothetical protein
MTLSVGKPATAQEASEMQVTEQEYRERAAAEGLHEAVIEIECRHHDYHVTRHDPEAPCDAWCMAILEEERAYFPEVQ